MKHKRIWLSIFISIVFLIMAACGSAAAPATPSPLPPTATPSPTVTATPSLGIGSTQVSPKDGMLIVYVPAGEFLMGSDIGDADEKPQHTVSLDALLDRPDRGDQRHVCPMRGRWGV